MMYGLNVHHIKRSLLPPSIHGVGKQAPVAHAPGPPVELAAAGTFESDRGSHFD